MLWRRRTRDLSVWAMDGVLSRKLANRSYQSEGDVDLLEQQS